MAYTTLSVTMRALPRALLLVMIGCVALVGMPPRHAQGMPSIGWKTISFGAANDVGPSTDDVRSVALGGLDHDGDLDIVSSRWGDEDCELIVWENDTSANRTSPFQGNR